jgi:hypothetical protein
MQNTALVRIAEETGKMLAEMDGEMPCGTMAPSYNALLQAAKANHPNDPFLSALTTFKLTGGRDPVVEDGDPTAAEMRALFAQLRIALESLQSESAA